MKYYSFVGCVVVFLSSILHETHQWYECEEIRDHLKPVEEIQSPLVEEIDVRLIYETDTLPDGVCSLVAWNSEFCGPIHFEGSVLIPDKEEHRIDIHSYNKDYSRRWLTGVTVKRVSDHYHIYKMKFNNIGEWIPEEMSYQELTQTNYAHRFNAHFAIVLMNGDQTNFAIKICHRTSEEQDDFFLAGGSILKKYSAKEESYAAFLLQVAAEFRDNHDLFEKINKTVPVKSFGLNRGADVQFL